MRWGEVDGKINEMREWPCPEVSVQAVNTPGVVLERWSTENLPHPH